MRSRARRRKRGKAQAIEIRNWNAGFELAFIRDRILEMMRAEAYQPIMAGDSSRILSKAVDEIDKALSVMARRMLVSIYTPRGLDAYEWYGKPMWWSYAERAKFRETMQWSAYHYGGCIKFEEAPIAEVVFKKPH